MVNISSKNYGRRSTKGSHSIHSEAIDLTSDPADPYPLIDPYGWAPVRTGRKPDWSWLQPSIPVSIAKLGFGFWFWLQAWVRMTPRHWTSILERFWPQHHLRSNDPSSILASRSKLPSLQHLLAATFGRVEPHIVPLSHTTLPYLSNDWLCARWSPIKSSHPWEWPTVHRIRWHMPPKS